MTRKPDWRRIKRHRAYTVNETALATKSHRNTVRSWIRAGLAVVGGGRPTLLLGGDIVAFLKDRSDRRRRKCGPGEMYCLKCRDAVVPDGGIADLERRTEKVGRLVGLCPRCGRLIFRLVSLGRLSAAVGGLNVQVQAADRRIEDTGQPTPRRDLEPRRTT